MVAEATSRRRSGTRGNAARAIASHDSDRRNIEAAIRAVAASTQLRSERTIDVDDIVEPDLGDGQIGESGPQGGTDRKARPARASRGAARPGGLARQRRQVLRGAASGSIGRHESGPPPGCVPPRGGTSTHIVEIPILGAAERAQRRLVDRFDSVGDPGPGVARGGLAGSLAHRCEPSGLQIKGVKLLGEALRVAGRHENPVHAVVTTLA